MFLRALAIAASICALSAAGVSAGAQSSGRPVYAVTDSGTDGIVLTRRDPLTLAPLGPSARLDSSSQPAAFSPNGSRLAFVEWEGAEPSVRVLDLSRMRWQARVSLSLVTGTVIVRWLDSSRVLVFAERPDGLRVFVLDTIRNRLGSARRIPGHLTDRQQVAVGRTRAAVLLRAVKKIGPARIAVVLSAGPIRIVTLGQIHEGAVDRTIYRPALVADSVVDRAYVVGGIREPVAAIDLGKLTVSYRRPLAPGGVNNTTGAERMTASLGRHRFAVAGWDDGAPGSDSTLLGLRVVDTRSWRAWTLDPETDFVCAAGRTLVGHHSDGTLVVFGFDGVRRLELDPRDAPGFPVPTASNGRYLYLPDPGLGALVADLASRTLIGRVPIQGLEELLSPTDTLGAGCR